MEGIHPATHVVDGASLIHPTFRNRWMALRLSTLRFAIGGWRFAYPPYVSQSVDGASLIHPTFHNRWTALRLSTLGFAIGGWRFAYPPYVSQSVDGASLIHPTFHNRWMALRLSTLGFAIGGRCLTFPRCIALVGRISEAPSDTIRRGQTLNGGNRPPPLADTQGRALQCWSGCRLAASS